MKKISTNAQLKAAIRKVVDDNWSAERQDFEENPLDGDDDRLLLRAVLYLRGML